MSFSKLLSSCVLISACSGVRIIIKKTAGSSGRRAETSELKDPYVGAVLHSEIGTDPVSVVSDKRRTRDTRQAQLPSHDISG